MSHRLPALMPAATLAPVRAPEPLEVEARPMAADPGRSGRRQRVPLVVGVVVAVAFVVASVSYVHLAGAADRRSGDRGYELAVPPGGPPNHDVAGPPAPSDSATDGIGQAPGPPTGVVPSGTPDVSAPPAKEVPPTRPPTGPTGSPTPPEPAELTATVSTAKRHLPPGYVGQVTVSNVGGTTATGWTVSMSIGGRARVSSVAGARFQQSGSVVTFVPEKGDRRIPPGESVRFAFRVVGLLIGRPTDCVVDDLPCQ